MQSRILRWTVVLLLSMSFTTVMGQRQAITVAHKDPSAHPSGRVNWSKQLSAEEVASYKPDIVLAGSDHWKPGRAD